MALSEAKPDGPRAPGHGSSGVSLLELIIAFSLSALVVGMALALYKDVGSAARILRGSREDDLEARILFNSLAENLMAGGGLLGISPNRLRLLNQAGLRMDYAWEDSTLTVNGRESPFRLASLEVTPFGPTLLTGDTWDRARMESADLDSLDDDRDGTIDFDELDRDRSGELEPWECRYVAMIRLTMTTVHDGKPTIHRGAVHPRNHAREWADDALDALPGVGDFGR